VAITEGPTGEIIALNAPVGSQPYPVPVGLAAPRDQAVLEAAAREGLEVSFIMNGRHETEALARNVVGRLDRGGLFVVVSTPQSGWFRCAAERGPGIALFLGLARWASKVQSRASLLFVSTSGHEIGGVGMERFLSELAPPVDNVRCWVHLGAGIASWKWESGPAGLRRTNEVDDQRVLMSSLDLVRILTKSFGSHPGLTPITGRAVGEFELLIKKGYRGFGIAAAHQFHHTPADSPEMTGGDLIETEGAAIVDVLTELEPAPG
jgi:hypothetical protein